FPCPSPTGRRASRHSFTGAAPGFDSCRYDLPHLQHTTGRLVFQCPTRSTGHRRSESEGGSLKPEAVKPTGQDMPRWSPTASGWQVVREGGLCLTATCGRNDGVRRVRQGRSTQVVQHMEVAWLWLFSGIVEAPMGLAVDMAATRPGGGRPSRERLPAL